MDLVYMQLPLVFFTAAAPMASGAFIGLACAFLTTRFSVDTLRRIDRWTLLPLAILAVGVVAAVVFLASPQSELLVIQGIDPGAFGFAAFMAVAFAVVALVYWIVAMIGRLSYGARKAFATVAAVSAVVYAVSIGVAYMMSAVPLWASIIVPIGFAGFSLASGVPLGMLVLALAKALPEARATRFGATALVVALVGTVAGHLCSDGAAPQCAGHDSCILPGRRRRAGLVGVAHRIHRGLRRDAGADARLSERSARGTFRRSSRQYRRRCRHAMGFRRCAGRRSDFTSR